MNGIVLELQKEAMDKNADIESLLRKSYVIARKLKLPDFQEWIQCEQEGYGKKETPEDTRTIESIKSCRGMDSSSDGFGSS